MSYRIDAVEVADLPLGSIRSTAPYVVVSQLGGLLSEHETATDAVEEMTAMRRFKANRYITIYKRGELGWEKL